MNPNEHQLQYPWGDAQPEPGTAQTVADGVKWIRMPLPFALDHINLWLLRDEIDGRHGWTVIDCGISRDEVKTLWDQVFERELEGLPVLRVLVTHMHPDHMGLADWICQRWQAPLWMSMTDYVTAALWSSNQSGAGPNGEAAVRHFAAHGMTDPESLEQIRQRAGYYPNLVPSVPRSFVRVMHGDLVRIGKHEWQVIVGYGHAPEHVSLNCDALRVMISGDMVLPRISTNVSVFAYEPESNPLPLYLDSLDGYKDLHADTLVLPSHGRPFKGLHQRIAQQHSHHADRLAEVLQACATPQSTSDIVPVLFKRKLDLHQMTFAMGEALAHLHALYFDGKLTRSTGSDGIVRFVAA
ncbi:MBL fold metallo-hydrolase [Bordetella genomosp. 13]|uniref:Zn-dependent hydrolase n=1 Tax=Bordetella genomosp. 13 TaxID=463040 RepID=A0A1W6Z6I8_9BORD|nr:MBL fold metallo-hydrolase [Bordetella genomosp. 13]ARP92969.1 Zn-dependent hydrolase [Bordetella genomosp. 13]